MARRNLFGLAAASALVGALAFVLNATQALPEGPVEPVWDAQACAHCRMHVGEPAFASQLQLTDGRVLGFDDPGCLFLALSDHPAETLHAIYFRHHDRPDWLTPAQVGFVAAAHTPMGFGLAAVERERPGAIDFETARGRTLAKARAQGGGHAKH
jgi:hypothetical protein